MRNNFLPTQSGPISGETAGRADKVPMRLAENSFVIPADCVSALGEGNTIAGFRVLSEMFPRAKADGGEVEEVPIVASDGEFVLDPSQVAAVGDGDIDEAHRTLDAFVLKVRREHIKTLRKLPPPKR